MESDTIYKSLCRKMNLEGSESLFKMWRLLLNESEARAADTLPATAADVSAALGMSVGEAEAALESLFKKGAAFKSRKGDTVIYRLARNIIQLHDATLLWDGAGEEFFSLWKDVMDSDFTAVMRNVPDGSPTGSFMRVIPVDVSLSPESAVLPYEECLKLIENSSALAVVKCPCRLSQQNCDAPLETCIQLNRGAEYVLERGHGREITRDEAVDILRISEAAGLVHMTENRDYGNAICNCCSCCCEMFRLVQGSGKKWILSPSRYVAEVTDCLCTACEMCVEVCPVEALSVDDIARVDGELCIGCGLCATKCPEGAITLREVRGVDHIPGK